MNQGTARVICSCENKFQDKMYGMQMRIANATQKGDDKQIAVRCTVCSHIQFVSRSKVN